MFTKEQRSNHNHHNPSEHIVSGRLEAVETSRGVGGDIGSNVAGRKIAGGGGVGGIGKVTLD